MDDRGGGAGAPDGIVAQIRPDERIVAQIGAPVEVALEQGAGLWTLLLRRRFPHRRERVWRMLTEPDGLARWSPIVPDRPLTSPGQATCREDPGDEPRDATVLAVQPPRLLVHRWGADVLSWTLVAEAGGTLLELRHAFADRGGSGSYAAGWRVCLGTLAACLDGGAGERVTGRRALDYGWEALRARYDEELT